ncbi:MAG TPA: tail-specific protease, partial [Cytophagales bacterium]|nr:tail-specific protease [Cytophagales bacterium]
TVVRLKILKAADGAAALPTEITLVRDKVNLEDEVAKSQVIPISQEGRDFRVGVITIPSFYMEFEAASRGEEDYNSTTRDVRRLITEMQNDGGIDALVIDLRFNGGGSLQEAITLSGLFIPDGPVVQVKDYRGKISVEEDPDESLFYDGPMGVMVNRFSASASEIFAGAIQDYERGVIMGDVTYGKGTVQNLIGLNNLPLARGMDEKLANVKVTLAKFYRVTGSSTQTLGVTPDVMFPSEFDRDEYGEASQPNELPWDQISSARFTKMKSVTDEDLEELNSFHQDRVESDPDLLALLDEHAMAREARQRTEVSLNEEERRAEQEERQARIAQQDNLMDDPIDPTGEGTAAETEKVDDTLLWEGVQLMAKLLNLHRLG